MNRNTFYQISRATNQIVRCIKFKKYSITCFFCFEEQLVFGTTENKILIYDLNEFDPENPDVSLFLSRNSLIKKSFKDLEVGCFVWNF